MKRLIAAATLTLASISAFAITPFMTAETKLSGGNLKAVMAAAEKKLTAAGFAVIGRYQPKGVDGNAVIVATEDGMTQKMKEMGGSAVTAIAVRVGVSADGTVSYATPEYWGRAYLRDDYGQAEAAVKGVAGKLTTAFGATKPLGGDVPAEKLPNYRYQFGMEKFDQKNVLNERFSSFDEAVKTVRASLDSGAAGSGKVYEIVYADKKLAVFGISQTGQGQSDGYWINKVNGAERVAGLPWEIFIVDRKVMAPHGRFRMALMFPDMKMGQWLPVGDVPDKVYETMQALAGNK